jgi:hypothetical protein
MASTVPPTDAELDALIKARLQLLGIDLGQLPVDDASAPADQTRLLRSLRSFLRTTVPVVSGYAADVQEFPPVLYPAPHTSWTR